MEEIVVGVAVDLPALVPWRHALAVAGDAQLRAVMVKDVLNRSALALASGDVLEEIGKRLGAIWDKRAEEVESTIREQAKANDVKVVVVRERGRFVDRILEASRFASMVVVGRGRGSDEHEGSLGSRVEVLVRRCRKALLITPPAYARPRRVVAAFAGKALGNRVLDRAAELARVLGTGLIVLTVEEDRGRLRDLQAMARSRLSHPDLDVEYVGAPGRPEEAIPARVSERDLLVLGPHGRSPLYRMLLGRVTDRVIRSVQGPFVLADRAG